MSSGPRPEAGEIEIARDATYHRAPEGLRARVMSSTAASAREERRPAMLRAFGLAAAFAAVGVLSWNVALMTAMPSREDTLAREVLSAHVRSLMSPGHLNDVESTDQHTVKPWFAGKLDFAPPVRDLAADGYPLAGGRLDYVDGRSVAELTYKRRLHTVSLFVWPDAGPDAAPAVRTVNGYSLATWKKGAMRYWAVTDAATPEIAHFAELMARRLRLKRRRRKAASCGKGPTSRQAPCPCYPQSPNTISRHPRDRHERAEWRVFSLRHPAACRDPMATRAFRATCACIRSRTGARCTARRDREMMADALCRPHGDTLTRE